MSRTLSLTLPQSFWFSPWASRSLSPVSLPSVSLALPLSLSLSMTPPCGGCLDSSSLPHPLIHLNLDAIRPDRSALGKRELEPVDAVREGALAASEERREEHQPELVDEIRLQERRHERAAPRDEDRAVGLVLELRDLLRDVLGDHGRVLPLRIRDRRRDDVLRIVVQLLGERAFAGGPRRREALVGDAPEELSLRVHELVELELVSLIAAVVLEGPAAVLVALGTARILEDSVDRDELCDDQLAHLCSPSFGVALTTSVGLRTHRC